MWNEGYEKVWKKSESESENEKNEWEEWAKTGDPKSKREAREKTTEWKSHQNMLATGKKYRGQVAIKPAQKKRQEDLKTTGKEQRERVWWRLC
ncbi:hypothetical protein AGMMS49950_11500 [Endomicrobiia bacterium]|nr:hypothetical protein AGMMS49950_11500 [Endomicrobiia bacterium]